MWELDYKESWVLKNWCFWTVVLETLQSSLDCKKIKPVHPKGNQFWTFIGRTDAEAETPILWPPDAKNWLIWKDPDAEKDWKQEEKGMTEDEMVGWSPTQWAWVWVNSGSWWWTGRPGVLRPMRLQRVRHDWATELNDYLLQEVLCHMLHLPGLLQPESPFLWQVTAAQASTGDTRTCKGRTGWVCCGHWSFPSVLVCTGLVFQP